MWYDVFIFSLDNDISAETVRIRLSIHKKEQERTNR